jgi:hypothetical protein
MKIKSGGGITSNKTVQSKSGWKQEPKPHAMSPAGVGQQGAATAFKKEPLEMGPGYRTGPQQPTGIAGARKGPTGAGPRWHGPHHLRQRIANDARQACSCAIDATKRHLERVRPGTQ